MTQVRRSLPERLPLPVKASRSVRKVHLLFLASLPVCMISALAPHSTATAQEVSSDGTVSTTVSTPDGKNFTINDGTTRGTNLFHSFKEFSVPTGGSATFNNAANIQNIISRVTGGSKSTIDGLIKANGGANLFLLNPAGILFGPNARLNIGGSFLGSTANSFIFDNGFEFSATNLEAPPLLTINLPIGLRYGDNPGQIQVQGRGHDINFLDDINKPNDQVPVRINNSIPGLQLESGKTLALVGGKVSLEGAILNSSSGRIEIGSVASNGTVSLVPVQEGWKLGYESIGSFGDIQFSGRTLLDTSGVGGGSIAVAGKNINFTGESILLADTLGDRNGGEISIVGDKISVKESNIRNFTFSSGNAGQVKLIANKSILLENNGGASTSTVGLGKAGEITLTADSIEVRDLSGLGSYTYGKGNGGRIEVKANSLLIEKNSGFGASSYAEGNAGEINIVVGDFVVRNQSGLGVYASNSTGNGGKINITANSLLISDSAGFSTATQPGSTGQAEDININVAGPVVVQKGSAINSDTRGAGNPGKISMTANSLQISDGSAVTSSTEQGSTGLGGEININVAGPVVVQKGSAINSDTRGAGNAGKISMTANSLQISDGSGVSSNVDQGSTGLGGEINLTVAGPVVFQKGAYIENSTSGTGNAGKTSIRANSLEISDGSGFVSEAKQGSTGLGGEINLTVAGSMVVEDRAYINNSTLGSGNAGKISITANSLQISDRSGISSSTQQDGTGSGGEINLNIAGPLILQKNAGINSNTENTGNAGQVTVNAESLEISDGSTISTSNTSTSNGNAGNLNVRAKTVSLDNDGRLQVSSTGSGNAGTLEIVADTIRLNNKSQINATSTSGNGGSITLDVANLLQLRRESFISATSGTTGSDGQAGNININTKFLIAFPQENSDIVATGFGRSVGSNVQVNASGGIFGIQYQPQRTPESDIVATGTVTLITLNTDPSDELFRLPQTVIDPAEQIAQNPCLRGGGEFTIVGRGGFPTDPNKVLSGDNARVDLVKPVASKTSDNSTSTIKQQPSTSATDKPIVPARGWIFNEKGEVVLVAYDPTKTGVERETQPSTSSCAVR